MQMPDSVTCPRDGARAERRTLGDGEGHTFTDYVCPGDHLFDPPLRPDGSFDLAADAWLYLGFRYEWAREICPHFKRWGTSCGPTGCSGGNPSICSGRRWIPKQGADAFLALVREMGKHRCTGEFDYFDEGWVFVWNALDPVRLYGAVDIPDALTAVEDAAAVAGARALGWPL